MLNNLQINWDKMYNEPTNYSWADILYKIRCDDAKQNLILDKLNFADLTEYYVDNTEIFDALVVPNNKLEKKMAILQRVMNTSAKTLNVITSQRTIPFKKNGVTNIANFFELSDGQTITIFFHNPDTTPNKIAPTDDIISYKWLLNKKDITIVVAPEKGHDLNIREVAKRIMKLAEKNSAAFARANKKRAEKAELYSQTEKEVAELEKQLADLQQQLEIAKVKRDELQIKLAEQSQNDFRDDVVKVSIKDNEKLQEVNNVQPVDKNMQGDDTIPEADDNNFELSTQINQDIKDVVNTALAKSNELQQQLQSITDPIEYKLLSNKIKYLKALQSAMENRDSLFSKWDYGLDLSDMTDVDLIETDNIEKVIKILDKLATNKHYSISKDNLFKLIGFTPSENTQKQEVNNEKEIDFNSAFELIKISLSSSNDIKDAAQNKNLADFMKYYNHFVEKFLVNKYADATDNHPEKEFLIKMLNDDNLRISTFKDFGEELYNKYNAETAENNSQNLVGNNNENISVSSYNFPPSTASVAHQKVFDSFEYKNDVETLNKISELAFEFNEYGKNKVYDKTNAEKYENITVGEIDHPLSILKEVEITIKNTAKFLTGKENEYFYKTDLKPKYKKIDFDALDKKYVDEIKAANPHKKYYVKRHLSPGAASILTSYDILLSEKIKSANSITELNEDDLFSLLDAGTDFRYNRCYSVLKMQSCPANQSSNLYLEKNKIFMSKAEKASIGCFVGRLNEDLNCFNNLNVKHQGLNLFNELLTSALNKLPNYVGDVYRGEAFDTKEEFEERFSDLSKDKVYTNATFLSTSAKETITKSFTRRKFNIQICIKSKNGKFVDPLCGNVDMPYTQILILKNKKLKYINSQKSENFATIWFEEI